MRFHPVTISLAAAVACSVLAPSVAFAQEPTAWVRVDASRSTRLMRASAGGWESVCSPPCDLQLPTGVTYRFEGKRGASESFVLRGDEGDRVSLHAHHNAGWVIGWVGIGVGGATSILGLSVALMSTISVGGSQCECRLDTTALAVGLAGVPVMLGGLALLLTNKETTVSQTREAPPRVAPSGASARTPAWPRAVGLPIVSGTF
jgi:hypothetical protein